MSSEIKVNKITTSSGSTLEFGGAGDTVSVGSGATVTGFGGGKVLQVVQTHVNTTSSQSLTANTRAQILGLNASITPSSTSSKIRITVRWTGESTGNNFNAIYGIQRDSTDIGNPAAAGNRNVGQATLYASQDANYDSTMDSSMYTYIDSPSTTSSITYSATIILSVNATLYNQRTVTDSDLNFYERATSNIILEEIAG